MSPGDAITQFRQPICEVVKSERQVKAGIAVATRVYGLPERRIRAAWHNEVREVLAHELDAVRRGYKRWASDRRVKLVTEIKRIEAQIRSLEGDDQ